jgi:hypothetical protein
MIASNGYRSNTVMPALTICGAGSLRAQFTLYAADLLQAGYTTPERRRQDRAER